MMQDELNDLAGAAKPIEIKIFGPDPAVLRELAVQAGEILESQEVKAAGIDESDNKVHEGNPDVYVQSIACRRPPSGSRPTKFRIRCRTALFGQVTNTVRQGDRLLNIRVRLPDAYRGDLDRLAALPIATPGWRRRAAGAIGLVQPPPHAGRKLCENQQPGIDVIGEVVDKDRLGAVVKAIEPKLRNLERDTAQRLSD